MPGIGKKYGNAMKTTIKNLSLLALMASLIVACSTSPRTPAPVVDRTSGASRVAGPGEYIVKSKDTLNRIAHRHGQTTRDLVAWNNLANPNDIKVGQVLRIQRSGSSAPVGSSARSGGMGTSGVDVKPLGTSSASSAGMNKNAPRGDKQPYSENAFAAMTSPAGVQAAPVAAPAAALPQSAPAVVDAAAAQDGAGISWTWPAEGRILATFQGRSKGLDIGGQAGQKIVAAADGQVSYVGALRGFGKLVIVKHSETIQSVYAHNRTILVKEKQQVTKGQPIAEMGNTDSDAVKLHFEVRRQGKPVDPARFLPAR